MAKATQRASAARVFDEGRTSVEADRADLRARLGAPSFQEMKAQGYSIIGTNPCFPTYISSGAGSNVTNKTLHKSAADATGIRLVFMNTAVVQGVGLNNNFNPVLVGASLQKHGASAVDDTGLLQGAFFPGGKRLSHVDPGALAITEPCAFQVRKNEAFYVRTFAGYNFPSAPAAPTLTPSATGGSLVTGASYYVILAYVFQDGFESLTSAATQTTIPAGSNLGSITITSPADVGGAIGYRCYISSRNAANSSGIFSKSGDTFAIGVNGVIGREQVFNALQLKRAAGYVQIVGGQGGTGGSLYDGLGTGEGAYAGDQTQNGFVGAAPNYAVNQYFPAAILGFTASPQKSVANVGDSIVAATGDHGMPYGAGGFSTRAVANQLQLCFDPATDPLYGYVRVPIGGESAAVFASGLNSNQYSRSRSDLTSMASNVVCNYGTNDPVDLTALKANILTIAVFYMRQGIKFFQCAIIPKTTSTDGWSTANNQTISAGFEAQRLAFNAWLRDASESGFVSQANAAAGTSGLADYMDVCKYAEVNAANVLTQDGGFWRIPTGVTPVNCTVTTPSGAQQWRDSSKTWVRNEWKGYSVRFTSGANINKVGCIGWNDASGTINTYGAVGVNSTIGDTYEITQLPTIDGTHPTSTAHIWMAQAVQEKFSELI